MKKFTRSFLLMLFASFFTLSAFAQPTILLVDRDGSSWAPDDFTDVSEYYMDILDDLGYDYFYWEVISSTDDGPSVDDMLDYDIVIWWTGEVWADLSTMTPNDEMNISLYCEFGGNWFMSAQDYLWDIYPDAGVFDPGTVPYEYLGLREVAQDVWNIDMPDVAEAEGQPGSVAEGLEVEFTDLFTSTREGLFIDNIVDHVGTDVFEIISPDPVGLCAVQYETDVFKTVFTTASFACLDDWDGQLEWMDNIINWFMGNVEPVCFPVLQEFDDLTLGGYLAEQDDCWSTWSGEVGGDEDALVVDAQAFSGGQSILVEGSTTDLIYDLGNKTEGEFIVAMLMYVEDGHGAYYNILHEFSASPEWAIEIYFDVDGTGFIHAGGANAATFTYPLADWFESAVLIDLDDDYAEYYVDDVLVHTWQWSLTSEGDPGLNQLGAVDIFAAAPTGTTPMFYFDDFYYDEFQHVGIGDPVSFSEISIFPNPATDFVSIRSQEVINEIQVFNNIGQMILDEKIDSENYEFSVSDLQPGLYTIMIRNQSGTTVEKLIIQ